jgi:hypothetical protein
MRSALLVLILALLPQDDARIRDWIRDLEEDSAVARDKALASLIQAGEAAEPQLKRAVLSGSAEVRSRAGEALNAIAWKRHYDPPPRLVTLRVDKMPLKKVLTELGSQSNTPINSKEVEEADAEVPVSVRVENVPLSKALEAICRAHGKIDYSIRCEDAKDTEVILTSEPFADCPRVIDGTIELRLQAVKTEVTTDLKGARTEKTTFDFGWHWEKGTHPLNAQVEIQDLRDEKDSSYVDRLEHSDEYFSADNIPTQLERSMSIVPPEEVTRFKVIKGELIVNLPLTVQEFSFDRPAEMIGLTRESRWGNVRLAEFEAGAKSYRLKVEARPQEFLNRIRINVLDRDGKELSVIRNSVGQMGDHGYHELDIPIEEDRIPATVRVTAAVGRRERRIPFEFRDVRFR